MFNVVRTVLSRRPRTVFLFIQNGSCQVKPTFSHSKRFIISSTVFNKNYLYHLIKRSLSSKDYPDHVVVKLPALSPTMESGGIASWAKQEGDKVAEGDLLAEIETDKATIGVEADDPGFLAKILVPAGVDNVKVGTPICIIVEKKENISAFKDYVAEAAGGPATHHPAPATPQPPATKKFEVPPPASAPPKGRSPKIDFKKDASPPSPAASPAASKKAALPADSARKYADRPIPKIRQVIAKRLSESKHDIPHFYLTSTVDVGAMESLRKVLNGELVKSGIKISVNDIIVKASALACKEIPQTNSSWMTTSIREYEAVDVSVAVSTPTGLITPIVFDADTKPVRNISTDIKELAKKAKLGKLMPNEFQGGTFTVSNLGMFGVKQFTAIINPPQSCILAVGATSEELYMKAGAVNSIGVKNTISVVLSCDHRVVDGTTGAQWLQLFKHFMENPKSMF